MRSIDFFSKIRIPYGQNFINNQNIGLDIGSHGKSQASHHAR